MEKNKLIESLEQDKELKSIIKDLKGINKTVFNYVLDHEIIGYKELFLILKEIGKTNASFKSLIIKYGFLKQKKIIEVVLAAKPEELMDDEVIEMSIPSKIFENHKIMLCGITDDSVYLSTLSSKYVAETVLRPYFLNKNFYFIPSNVNKIQDYINKVRILSDSEYSFFEQIVRDAIRKNASDIHIEPESETFTVHYRILGELYPQYVGDMKDYHKLITIIKVKTGMDYAEKRIDQDGHYTLEFDGRNIDLRIICSPSSYKKENAVIRILDPDNTKTNLSELGISELDKWKKAISLKKGLCLICGVTGSGKSTTLNTTIRTIDRFSNKVVTIEDPVEYNIFNVSQVSVNNVTGMSFARAIRANMRADPDVIIVGEVRDEDTALNMLKGAETGHLVLATLHTGTIRGAVDRLKHLGISKDELVEVLKCILVQALIKVVCKKCNGKGCEKCKNYGYTDRTIVSELKYFETEKDVMKFLDSKEIDWVTKEEDAYFKYKDGITTKEEIDRYFGDNMTPIYRKHESNNEDKE